jgi:hypothetical protein
MDKDKVISVIAEVFNVDENFATSRIRKRKYTYPKKALCMYLYNNSELT